MKIKLLLVTINLVFLTNFIDYDKLKYFIESESSSISKVVETAENSNAQFKRFSLAFQNRYEHHIQNLKENLGIDN